MAASFCPRSIRRPQVAPTIRPAPFPAVGAAFGRPLSFPQRGEAPAKRVMRENDGPQSAVEISEVGSALPHLSAALTSSPAGGGTNPSVTAAGGGDTSPCRGGQCVPRRGALRPCGRPRTPRHIRPERSGEFAACTNSPDLFSYLSPMPPGRPEAVPYGGDGELCEYPWRCLNPPPRRRDPSSPAPPQNDAPFRFRAASSPEPPPPTGEARDA